MKALVFPFMVLSVFGLILSLIAHVCSLVGIKPPFSFDPIILHVGVFVVWFPAVLVATRLSKTAKRKDFWKATLRGCPVWMKRILYVIFVYAIVNFAVFMFMRTGNQIKGFSGHWMAFYAAAGAILYSFRNAKELKCPNGHDVSVTADFCETCGTKINRSLSSQQSRL